MSDLEALKYPIGKFNAPKTIERSDVEKWIHILNEFPSLLNAEVSGLPEDQLAWCYRPGGWSIRQVVHHYADSHFNSFFRFKLALTEQSPAIKPYDEAEWAKLPDSLGPIGSSLSIIDGLHQRWCQLLKSLDEKTLKHTFFHPEQQTSCKLDDTVAFYAWHCEHHLGHIRQAKSSQGKYN